jgi:hypothetical protein
MYTQGLVMTRSGHREFHNLMKQLTLIALFTLVAAPGAFAQSDEELIETVRTSAKEVFLEQMSFTVPESFQNSGLSQTDKERILLQLASDSADCLADSAVEYAALHDTPISDFVSSEGTIGFRGDSGHGFTLLLNQCILLAWQVAGISTDGFDPE